MPKLYSRGNQNICHYRWWIFEYDREFRTMKLTEKPIGKRTHTQKRTESLRNMRKRHRNKDKFLSIREKMQFE